MDKNSNIRYSEDNLLESRYLPNSDYTYYGRIALLTINSALVFIPGLRTLPLNQLKRITIWGINWTEISIVFSIWAMNYN